MKGLKKFALKNLFKKTDGKGNLLKVIGGIVAGTSALTMEPDTVKAVASVEIVDSVTELVKQIGLLLGLVVTLIGQLRGSDKISSEDLKG